MQISIILTDKDLKKLVLDEIRRQLDSDIKEEDIRIEVKSKQNYKADWEVADFRATICKTQ